MSPLPIRNPHALRTNRTVPAIASAAPLPVQDRRPVGVIVCPDALGGRLSLWDRRALGAARRLADDADGSVLAIARDDCTDDLGSAGADARAVLDRAMPVEQAVAALCNLLQSSGARCLMLPDSEIGGDLGRRIAAKIGERPNTAVWKIQDLRATSLTGSRRGAYVGDVHRVLLVADGAEAPYAGARRAVVAVPFGPTAPALASPFIPGREWRLPPGEVALEDAEFVIGGGLGVVDWSLLQKVASDLGASFGASRPVIDKGILARSRQIGATGAMLGARCYIAMGISGAPQHLEGLKQCDFVIGVNRDKDSPIARRADIFIQADADAILQRLAELTQKTT